MIEFVDSLPLPDTPEAKYTAGVSDRLFAYGDKLFGGIARETLFEPPELWVFITPAFRPRDIFRLRETVPQLQSLYPYVRARTKIGDEKSAKFARTYGMEFEAEKDGFNFFSMRAR